MASDPMQKYQDIAEKIVSSFDVGRRMDIFLLVRSKDSGKIDRTAAYLSQQLDCSATEARIAMKEYVAHLKNYDPQLVKELQ